jgi:phosphoribosylaminoimidazolecarboxamide formyltransferase/IMP cyclohydrolase
LAEPNDIKHNYKMSAAKTIKSALISVFSKEGLEPIVRQLHEQNVTFWAAA